MDSIIQTLVPTHWTVRRSLVWGLDGAYAIEARLYGCGPVSGPLPKVYIDSNGVGGFNLRLFCPMKGYAVFMESHSSLDAAEVSATNILKGYLKGEIVI